MEKNKLSRSDRPNEPSYRLANVADVERRLPFCVLSGTFRASGSIIR
jgi:hypothetical protein